MAVGCVSTVLMRLSAPIPLSDVSRWPQYVHTRTHTHAQPHTIVCVQVVIKGKEQTGSNWRQQVNSVTPETQTLSVCVHCAAQKEIKGVQFGVSGQLCVDLN